MGESLNPLPYIVAAYSISLAFIIGFFVRMMLQRSRLRSLLQAVTQEDSDTHHINTAKEPIKDEKQTSKE
ncbi:MAG: hypothetical protein H6618_01835 [Deltaproteobacteria bacterium]|nr:hypothetical protein [Deltaproteobacteria bacterium]